nr:helix-turn-helix domain-containing protein [Streptomyces antibioticus]
MFREHIRMQAAELFALGRDNADIAKQLRVSVRSMQRWHQAWERGGRPALESKGQASRPGCVQGDGVRVRPCRCTGSSAERSAGSNAEVCTKFWPGRGRQPSTRPCGVKPRVQAVAASPPSIAKSLLRSR